MAKNLVIVESPAKSKTIKKFLWPDYEVKASYGHVSDLVKKNLGVDINNNFQPTYEISSEKKKVISELRKQAKAADKVWIATDEDREGEAIGRHVCNALKLDPKTTARIVFHEITKNAITNAVQNPRTLNMDLVDAQQARRVLDRVVGFQVSPVLRDKVKRGLSAGRVQSVAVKLIVEKEREIQNFDPKESRKLFADITHKTDTLQLECNKINGKKTNLKSQEKLTEYLQSLWLSIETIHTLTLEAYNKSIDKKTNKIDADNTVLSVIGQLPFTLVDSIEKDTKSTPPPPFITSTLQQTASRILGRSVKQVMSTAQKLYEHGHITYMRTDSVNLSKEARETAGKYVTQHYGANYYKSRAYKGKSANAQEAHEAIRPTHIEKWPKGVTGTAGEKSLYELIWARAVASQMAEAKGKSTTYIFEPAGKKNDERTIKGEVMVFDGWTKIGGKLVKKSEDVTLPIIEKGTILDAEKIIGQQHFSKPPARYTEATLVKALEANGIGRPSTYAPTISTVQARGYVELRDDKKLHPTDIAFTVTDFLNQHFSDMMDYEFTAHMEEKLDHVSYGEVQRQDMMKEFYTGFKKELEKAGHAERKIEYTWAPCPKCGGQLVYKYGRTGKFISCENYPDCDHTENLPEDDVEIKKLEERFGGKPCPEGGMIVIKKGKYGFFLASSEYPKVKWISAIPDPIQEILEAQLGKKNYDACEGGDLVVKKTKRRGEVSYFLACSNYPKVKHIENIDKEIVKEAIEQVKDNKNI